MQFGCSTQLVLVSMKCIDIVCFYCTTYVWRMKNNVFVVVQYLLTAKLCS